MPPPPQTTAGGSTFDKSESRLAGRTPHLGNVANTKQ